MRKRQLFIIIVLCSLIFSVAEIKPKEVFSQGKANFACSQYPSGVQTPSAKDPSLVDQAAYQAEGATWDYRWEADCSHSCTSTSDCVKNTSNQPAVKPDNSAWCFEFTDGNRCMILTTTDKGPGQDKNSSGGKYGQYGATPQAGAPTAGSPSQPGATSYVCQDPKPALKSYYDAKVANNLVRFYAMANGAGGLCVPADLGVPPQIDEEVSGVKGRLMACSSEGGGKLYWMVGTEKGLVPLPETQKRAPEANTIEAGFDQQHLQDARCIAGLETDQTKCKKG